MVVSLSIVTIRASIFSPNELDDVGNPDNYKLITYTALNFRNHWKKLPLSECWLFADNTEYYYHLQTN